MSHVSHKLKQGWIPCEVQAMNDCTFSEDGETCITFKDPDNCLKYKRVMVLEGEEPFQPWLFNCFNSKYFATQLYRFELESQGYQVKYYGSCPSFDSKNSANAKE